MCFYSLSYEQEERVLVICGKAVLTPSDGTDAVTISAGVTKSPATNNILLQQTIPARNVVCLLQEILSSFTRAFRAGVFVDITFSCNKQYPRVISLFLSLSLSLCVCVSVCVYYIDT